MKRKYAFGALVILLVFAAAILWTVRSSNQACAETAPNGSCLPIGQCNTPTDGIESCKSLYPNYPDKD